MGAPSDEFEAARRVAVRMMETRAFAKGIEEEDPRMVAYIPQLLRLNELGMITFNSQSGERNTFPHYQTGEDGCVSRAGVLLRVRRRLGRGRRDQVDVEQHGQVRDARDRRRGSLARGTRACTPC